MPFLTKELKKRDDRGLVGRVQSGVGLVPGSENAQALEVGPLQVEEFFGVQAALLAHLQLAHALFARAQFLVHLVLDGQAVAVPARDVRAVKPFHGFALDHEILEDLVQGRAQVDVAVGVGRAVVQDIGFPTGMVVQDFIINIGRFPFFQGLGLFLAELGFHGKVGARQVKRILPVHFFFRHGMNSGLI